ncbi:MAG TPA: proline--tRNA ligase [Aggregatilineales bacterium]|nr:proline--tRNA ligase [Aggregatilineales bacterium]
MGFKPDNFSEWYNNIIRTADLADYAPVRGCMIIRPYGYALWEGIQAFLDRRFKETGHQNAYFPLFIPESFIRKEAENFEGFAPELAIVTIGGGKELEEKLVVRPTSETIIGDSFSKWIQSYRDLPMLMNQWANVVRWELRTRPFLRTLEFLWQEGHTAHSNEPEAEEETIRMLGVYTELALEAAAIPVIRGRKSNQEKFAGAVRSYSIEGMMGDKKALQAGTSHMLGQNFAKAFEIRYTDINNQLQYCWTTSWGLSTRFIGAIIMAHGDEKGLRLPPKLAPIQVVIVPIYKNEAEKSTVMPVVDRFAAEAKAAGVRLHIDTREDKQPGFKYNDWEMRGVPVRVEIGPKDVQNNTIAVARRDVDGKAGKQFIPREGAIQAITSLLGNIHKNLLQQATQFRDANIHEVTSDYEKFKEILTDGWAYTWFCGSAECEAKIKEDNQAVSRNFPLGQEKGTGPCILCGQTATERAMFAKAY